MSRPVGSKNTKTEQWETFSLWLMTEGMKRFQTEMRKLNGKEYILTVKDLLEYFKPKLARTEHTGENGNALIFQVINYADTAQLPTEEISASTT